LFLGDGRVLLGQVLLQGLVETLDAPMLSSRLQDDLFGG
jgi:hypothetical protein